jgi:hypothetical protein
MVRMAKTFLYFCHSRHLRHQLSEILWRWPEWQKIDHFRHGKKINLLIIVRTVIFRPINIHIRRFTILFAVFRLSGLPPGVCVKLIPDVAVYCYRVSLWWIVYHNFSSCLISHQTQWWSLYNEIKMEKVTLQYSARHSKIIRHIVLVVLKVLKLSNLMLSTLLQI